MVSFLNNLVSLQSTLGLRFEELDTKVDDISNHLASNLTEILTSLDILESKINSSDVSHIQQRVDKIENEGLPALQKDRIKI